VEVDNVLIGMGERYDLMVTVQPGVWPLVAVAEGKKAAAVAVLRTMGTIFSPLPPVETLPFEFLGRPLEYKLLRATDKVRFEGKPDTTIDVDLTGDMAGYKWALKPNNVEGPIQV